MIHLFADMPPLPWPPMSANDFATWLVLLADIPALLFTLIYGFASPWYKSGLGVTVLGLGASIAGILTFIAARRVFGDFAGFEGIALVLYGGLNIALWAMVFSVVVGRRKPRSEADALHFELRPPRETRSTP